jgi:SAM-dependent methyltransferase
MAEIEDRAAEIAEFLGSDYGEVLARLSAGFHHNHALVAEGFRKVPHTTEEELLQYYRNTEDYIFELSSFHMDEGFNHVGFCAGVAEMFGSHAAQDILVLGDGIGDLSLALHGAGFNVTYHDLEGSRTSEYALHRARRKFGDGAPAVLWTEGFVPEFGTACWDGICSADYLEHMPNVEDWVDAVLRGLRPGGLFAAQNAFNCGSGEDGSIPMHLESGNYLEWGWVPLMESKGFTSIADIWWVAPC